MENKNNFKKGDQVYIVTISQRAQQILREIGRKPDGSAERFTAGNLGEYMPWDHSMEARLYHEETRQAALELVNHGCADTSNGAHSLKITLTQKGAELSRYLSS